MLQAASCSLDEPLSNVALACQAKVTDGPRGPDASHPQAVRAHSASTAMQAAQQQDDLMKRDGAWCVECWKGVGESEVRESSGEARSKFARVATDASSLFPSLPSLVFKPWKGVAGLAASRLLRL